MSRWVRFGGGSRARPQAFVKIEERLRDRGRLLGKQGVAGIGNANDRNTLAKLVAVARLAFGRNHYIVLPLYVEYRCAPGVPPFGLRRCIRRLALGFLHLRIPAAEPDPRIAVRAEERVLQV